MSGQLVPDRGTPPPKKRDQRRDALQQLSDAATFKVPYPRHGSDVLKSRNAFPLQPIPRRVTTLYQPWTQTHTTHNTKNREHLAADLTEITPLHSGWDHPKARGPLSGQGRDARPPALQPGHLHFPFEPRLLTLLNEDVHRFRASYRCDAPLLGQQLSLTAQRQAFGGNSGHNVKRRDRLMDDPYSWTSPPTMTTSSQSPSAIWDNKPNKPPHELFKPFILAQRPLSSPNFKVSPGYVKKDDFRVSISSRPSPFYPSSPSLPSTPSPGPEAVPWLLPHFAAGSLIELWDGQLRRVEDLRTEDFLLGSLVRRGLRLSCCTVQSITPSASRPSLSCLLVLLHDHNSQEYVDVYEEYPFFVRGRGWSSCRPERTACLCGLRCRQLSVGDVCLALTPVPPSGTPRSRPPPPPPPAPLTPSTTPRKAGGYGRPKKQAAPPSQTAQDGQTEGRKRHLSAPELNSTETEHRFMDRDTPRALLS